MTRLSLLTAVGLSLSLSPLVLSAAAADPAKPQSLPAHKALGWLHHDNEACHTATMAAQASAGAFLEMTAAAP